MEIRRRYFLLRFGQSAIATDRIASENFRYGLQFYLHRSGGHAVREHYQAIIIAGLVSGVIGGAWMWINRYEIKPVDSESFRLRNRLTGQVELCAMIDANTTYKTYCGAELKRRKDQMRQESSAGEFVY
jgi:hypothetical protein